MNRRSCMGILLASTLVLAKPGHAAPTAKQKELQARKAFAAGDWATALDLFAQLYAETLHPNYLRNIGRCHQKMGVPDKAIGAFRDYLARARNVGADERKEIEGYIAEMEKLRDEQNQAREAKQAQERTPAPAPTSATTIATAPAAPPPPPPAVTAPAPEPESKPIVTRWWFWTAIGAVAAGVAAAALLSKSDPCKGLQGCQ